jgi:hypothetical protein
MRKSYALLFATNMKKIQSQDEIGVLFNGSSTTETQSK